MTKLYAGVDLGGTSMIAVVADRRGKVRGESGTYTLRDAKPADVIDQVADQIRTACKKASVKPSALESIGVGAPGAVEGAMVVRAPNLKWTNVPMGSVLSKRFRVPVALGNDVQVAILGEHSFGAAKGTNRAVGIWVGTGIGGGLIINGKLYNGSRGAAGEIGHMAVSDAGPLCPCGRNGCVEAFASRTSMERRVREAIALGRESVVPDIMRQKEKDRMTSSVIARALKADDAVMKEVFASAQHYLGLLAGNIVNLLDPEVIVIGGGIAQRLGDSFVAPIRETAQSRYLRPDPKGEIRIVPAALGDHSGALGASMLARKS